ESRLDQCPRCIYFCQMQRFIRRSAMQAVIVQMPSQQIALVRESFAKVAPISEQVAAVFYDYLFVIDPSTRPLFRDDMKSQGAKLMAAIGAVVKSLDQIETML